MEITRLPYLDVDIYLQKCYNIGIMSLCLNATQCHDTSLFCVTANRLQAPIGGSFLNYMKPVRFHAGKHPEGWQSDKDKKMVMGEISWIDRG
jgi:hypothetical protein